MSFDCDSIRGSVRSQSKENGRGVGREWRLLRSSFRRLTFKRLVQWFQTQKRKCRAVHELSIGIRWHQHSSAITEYPLLSNRNRTRQSTRLWQQTKLRVIIYGIFHIFSRLLLDQVDNKVRQGERRTHRGSQRPINEHPQTKRRSEFERRTLGGWTSTFQCQQATGKWKM